MKTRYASIAFFLFGALLVRAQSYCTPSFPNGCFNWRTVSVSAGSINWTPGVDDCSVSDYTNLSTTVNAGDDLAMTVETGVWCGCAVWVDLDNSSSFEDSENLYFAYVGADPSYAYNFSISVPGGTPTGAYRMRVVAPWGSDGFLDTNTNGYGPCGSYQYGNFNDFTLNVVGSNGLAEVTAHAGFAVAPNPASNMTQITASPSIDQLTVRDAQGRVVEQHFVQGDRFMLDAHALSSGVYMVQVSNARGTATQRLVIE